MIVTRNKPKKAKRIAAIFAILSAVYIATVSFWIGVLLLVMIGLAVFGDR